MNQAQERKEAEEWRHINLQSSLNAFHIRTLAVIRLEPPVIIKSWPLIHTHPDGVRPRALKACADQLYGILQHQSDLSLNQERVLGL